LEQRGITVITSSGVLVTLLFGLSGAITARQGYSLPGLARVLLVVSALLFVAAACLGILISRPVSHRESDPDWMEETTQPSNWTMDGAEASRLTARSRLRIIESGRVNNDKKAKRLTWAITAEVLAIVLVAVTVIVVLIVG
jgi:hypothetical protein